MNSLRYHWIRGTFIAVGVLLVGTALILAHATSTRTLREQLTDSNAAVLNEVASHISERISRLDQRLIELAGRRGTIDLMHSRFESDQERIDTANIVQTELRLIRLSDELVNTAGVHSARSEYFLSDKIGLSYLNDGDPRHVDVPVMRSSMETILHAGADFRLLRASTEQGQISVVPLRRPYPLRAGESGRLGNLFISIDTHHISNMVLQASRERVSQVLLADSSGPDAGILTASSAWALERLVRYVHAEDGPAATQRSFETRLGGTRYGIARVTIPETGWVLVGAVPLSGGTPLLMPMQLTFLLIGTGMLVTVLLSFLALSHITIAPLTGFVRRVSMWVPDTVPDSPRAARFPASGKDLSRLEMRFQETIDESIRLKDRFTSTAPIIQRYCLRNLFSGTEDADALIAQLAEHGVQLHTGAFVALRLALTEHKSSARTPSGASSMIPRNAHASISEARLGKLSSWYLAERGRCAVLLEKNNRVSVLISAPDRAALEGPSLMTLAEQIRIGLASSLGVSVSAGLGSIETVASRISTSWRHATKALDYTLMFQTRALYRYDDIELVDSSNAMRNLLLEVEELQESVRSGDRKSAEGRVATLFRDARTARLSGDSVRQLGVHVLMEGLRVAQESGCLIPEDHAREVAAVWQRFDEAETIDQIEQITQQVVTELTTDVGRQRQEHHRHVLIDSIIEYLEEQYGNPDISLAFVAERFSISPAHLSKLFKEHAGLKYVEFLSRLRVTVAKSLLERGTLNVNEVAQKVGYTNSRSFIRMFRMETGYTPGEYRRLYVIRNSGASHNITSDDSD
ncbi:MAG: AraC family transcriptional regulator [Spirochaetaceae bacterium]